jgi:extracellular elastinolytic metalloproteinase
MPYKPFWASMVLVVSLLAAAPGSLSAQSSVDALDVALTYADKNAAQLGVTRADVADLFVTSNYRSSHNGVTHVNLNQRYQGLEVFGGHVTVNVAADGRVVFAGGSLVGDLAAAPSGSTDLKVTEAVEAAASALQLGQPTDLQVISSSSQRAVVTGGGISDAPIPLRLGWQPTDRGLRLAWQLVIDDSSGASLWNATIDAANGALLDAADWTSNDNPADLASTLTRAGAPTAETSTSSLVTPNPVNDGSSYRVFELPKESPNDGPRTLVQNPADAMASPLGWHDTNGVAGPEFTNARGTNAHAYLDQDSSNAPDFGEPDGGPGLDFDFTLDLAEHAQNYREATVSNLFYWNNIIHDVTYQYGFTEAAGNFQAFNYGRGGTQGDYVRAEAADGAGTNNANFSTPVETPTSGGTPRMQMFLWPGNQFGAQNQVVVPNVGSFDSSWARFSPAPSVAGTSGQLINAGNGCTAADYAGAPAGDWIAIVTGSNLGCQNVEKARQASTAGANALIVALNSGGAAPILTGSLATAPPTIPVASITQADGNTIRTAIAAGTTTGTVRKHPSHPGIRDGDLESGIIIHEYGHGISNRLTGGPEVNCLSGNEQAGEGWSDYFAITMLLDPALDNPNQPRGMGPYALFQNDRHGAGIRPRPYSRDMSIQPFTYDSIKTGGWLNGTSLALPHGLGHGWASVLWDLDWNLIDKHGFNPNVYGAWNAGGNNRSLQYVIDGLKMQGCGPGLVVARGAIVAATEELGGEDTCTAWATFARRGLGFSAVQGTTNRDDNEEAFDTHPDCLEGFFGGVAPGPTLNVVNPGAIRPMTFTLGGNQGLDILASDSPYSRMVDCNTLKTVDPASQFITPRPIPVETETPGGSGLSYDPTTDRYTYPWKTLSAWNGTCREFVLTRTDGVQHRAFFRFSTAPSFPVSGTVRNTDGQAVEGATVTLTGTQSPLTATTDADGFYSFASVIRGSYTGTASAGGCDGTQTTPVEVQGPTTVDFTLPPKSDSFGYTCRLTGDVPFDEADTVLALTGDDVSTLITLPFEFTLYGTTYTGARVCTNGYIELGAPASLCSVTNAAIPTTGRPNGAIYAYWDDLFVDPQASVRTQLKGTAPNRRFVIEYRNVHYFSDTTRRIDVSLVLHENGQVQTQTRNLADDGRERGNSATLGIENAAGNIALRFSFNEAVLGVEPGVNTITYQPPA